MDKVFFTGNEEARRHRFFLDQFGQIQVFEVGSFFLSPRSEDAGEKNFYHSALIKLEHTAGERYGVEVKARLNEAVRRGQVDIVVDQRFVDSEHTARAVAGDKDVVFVPAVLFQMIFDPQ